MLCGHNHIDIIRLEVNDWPWPLKDRHIPKRPKPEPVMLRIVDVNRLPDLQFVISLPAICGQGLGFGVHAISPEEPGNDHLGSGIYNERRQPPVQRRRQPVPHRL